MGVVYEALDEERQTRVALKTLPDLEPGSLFRFKQEFRSLAGIVHANLVSLYELFAEQGVWFFSMEFVDGCDFLAHVRQDASEDPRSTSPSELGELIEAPETATVITDKADLDAAAGGRVSSPVRDYARLRRALRQAALGLDALHQAGKLHRDIKPSNVLVTTESRVVVLDFGLVAEAGEGPHRSETMSELSGTVAYMSPEQAAQEPLTAAADWYSVGVMLYEALTGRLPFRGSVLQVLSDKQQLDPAPPSKLIPDVPSDLDALCRQLLARDPVRRPGGREILARLSEEPERVAVSVSARTEEGVFVGRRLQMAELREALEWSLTSRPAIALVSGPSGSGKSALLERFLAEIRSPGVTALPGRCYEQESVPYKGLDSLVDSLAKLLRRMPRAEAAALLPRDAHALARLFPVLRRAEVVADAPSRKGEILEQHEARRRAFQALKELLNRMADRKTLVLAIDDLQWGDADSAAALSTLFAPPDAPPALLVCAYRSEDAETSACLRAILKPAAFSTVRRFEIEVGALAPDEALDLAETLLEPLAESRAERAEAIARESRGHAYFIRELCAAALADPNRAPSGGGAYRLDEIIWRRVSALPDDARRLLEAVAVSGRPLAQVDAYKAAGILDRRPSVLALLRGGRLARSTGPRERDFIEAYHDRIRETIVGRLAHDVLRRIHRDLALALEESGRADAETLAAHFEGSGDRRRAGKLYAAAAEAALSAVAFDRSAGLYRRALELLGPDAADRRALELGLAGALAGAGRGFEAAAIYERLAAEAGERDALELKRLAAQQYGITGHIDRAASVMTEILASAGFRVPRTRAGLAAATIAAWCRLNLRGLRYRVKTGAELDPRMLERVDIAGCVSEGMTLVNMFTALYFGLRGLLMALDAGDPRRIARAAMLIAPVIATTGPRGRRRARAMLAVSREIAAGAGAPEMRGTLTLADGLIAFTDARWPEALDLLSQAENVLGSECTGVNWELASTRVFMAYTLQYLGAYGRLALLTEALLKDAEERGDLFTAANVALWPGSLVLLARDEPDRVPAAIDEHLAKWSRAGYHHEHWLAGLGLTCAELYRGDGLAAWRVITGQWRLMRKSLFAASETYRVATLHYRAQSALAAAAADPARRGVYLRAAERDAKRLGAEKLGCARAWSLLARAGAANARGDRSTAASLLERAAGDFDSLGMALLAASSRYRLAKLAGDKSLEQAAETWMREQGIRDPGRMAAVNANGFA